MPALARLFLAAFLTDASLYLAFAALPFRAMDLGAGSISLGILPTLYAIAYMSTAQLGGRLSDRAPRLVLARLGVALFFLGCLALSRAPALGAILVTLPALGLGLGFFWSPVQAAVSDRVAPGRLSRAVMGFNVAWSLGKGSGLVVGGILTERLAPSTALLVAGFPALLTLALLPADVPRAAASPPGPTPTAARTGRSADVFLRLAWMTNAIAFGLGSTMNVHAPKLLVARGAGPIEFGVILGTVFAAQTLTFAALAEHRPGRSALLGAYAAGLAALVGFLFAPGLASRVIAALPLGICLGIAYQTSIYASLDRSHGRGRAAGLHETLLGAGSSSLPLLGGAAAALTGALTAPFLLGVGVLLVGIAVTRAVSPAH
jgi:predicted MFS family arabinose efflux permease